MAKHTQSGVSQLVVYDEGEEASGEISGRQGVCGCLDVDDSDTSYQRCFEAREGQQKMQNLNAKGINVSTGVQAVVVPLLYDLAIRATVIKDSYSLRR